MKRLIKASIIFLSLFMALCFCSVCAFAQENNTVLELLMSGNQASNEVKIEKISYALDVIAAKNDMSIAGVCGNALNFSADRFACAMNLSSFDYITVTSLPDVTCGSLYIGSEGVSVNQKISAADVSLMTYEESPAGEGNSASFNFRIDENAYEITCNVYMINDLNYSPTVNQASYLSVNARTYKDVMVSGSLYGYDPEGDELTFEVVKYPSRGILTIDDQSIGTYSYVPEQSYTGNDSFTYVVRDKYGNYSASAQVNIEVLSVGNTTMYSDLIDDSLHSHAISVTEKNLMSGVRVGDYYYFEPEREVSRAEFIVTAMNAVGIKNVPDVEETGFYDDESINPEMKGYISLAYSKGYISGIKKDGNLYFLPQGRIDFSEAAVIISNMIGYADSAIEPVFADGQQIPEWSERAIESLYVLGILEAPNKIVNADATITRGDMAKLLNKTMFIMGQ